MKKIWKANFRGFMLSFMDQWQLCFRWPYCVKTQLRACWALMVPTSQDAGQKVAILQDRKRS